MYRKVKTVKQRLYVVGLPREIDETELRKIFARAGGVERVVVRTLHFAEESRRFGFVDMETEEEAWKAIRLLHGSFLNGKKLAVSIS